MTETCEKFIVYTEEFDYIKDYSNEEVGMLLRALIHFVKTGEEAELDDKIKYSFRFMSAHIERDRERYNNMIEKRRASGKKGAEARFGKKTSEAKEEIKTEKNDNEIKSIQKENPAPKSYQEATQDGANSKDDSIQKSTEEKRLDAGFDEFWECYPKKQDKESAKSEYFALCPTPQIHEKIINALKKQKKTEEWQREKGRFIPHPAKWLKGKRWEDKTENTFSTEDSFYVDEFFQAALKKSTRDYKL